MERCQLRLESSQNEARKKYHLAAPNQSAASPQSSGNNQDAEFAKMMATMHDHLRKKAIALS